MLLAIELQTSRVIFSSHLQDTVGAPQHMIRVRKIALRSMASLITVSHFTAHASRRGVGQWGGASGACCEDHLALLR